MAKTRKLTPGVLKRIIAEERSKLASEKRRPNRAVKRSARKPAKANSRQTLQNINDARRLRIAEARLKRALTRISKQRRVLRNKISKEL